MIRFFALMSAIVLSLTVIVCGAMIALGGQRPAVPQLSFVTIQQDDYTLRLADTHHRLSVPVFTVAERLSTPVWSPDGSQVAYRIYHNDRRHRLYIYDMDTREVTLSWRDGNTFTALPAWSPEGDRIAFVSNEQGGYFFPYVLDLENGSVSQLTRYTVNDITPIWSADGEELRYSAWRSNRDVLISVETDGNNERVLLPDYYRMTGASWSPDREQVAFSNVANSFVAFSGIFVLEVDEGAETADAEPVVSSRNANYTPAWSPDGTQIAFVSNRAGTEDLYLIDVDGDTPRQLTALTTSENAPLWSPDSTEVAFVATPNNGVPILYTVETDSTTLNRITFEGMMPAVIAWRP